MTDEHLSHPPVFLSSDAAKALDELAGAGFDPDPRRSPLGQSSRIVALLNLLDHIPTHEADPAQRELLVNITMARVIREQSAAARIEPATPTAAPVLSERSAAAIDAIVHADWTADTQDNHQTSAAALASLLSAAPQPPADQRQSLIERTLGAIQSNIDADSSRFRFDPINHAEIPRSSFSIRDLIAVAAMLLISTAILWPVFVQSRHDIHKTATRMNMSQAGFAFASFSNDHAGSMPQAAPLATKWWNVGDHETSHSANLYKLAFDRYATLQDLSCPSNPFAPTYIINNTDRDWHANPEVSFSLQLYPSNAPRLNDGRTHVILADRSPVIRRIMLGERVDPNAPSSNHAGHGQHVLLNDASVLWLTTPFLPGSSDNIWLPAAVERRLSGGPSRVERAAATARPTSMDDTFVAP